MTNKTKMLLSFYTSPLVIFFYLVLQTGADIPKVVVEQPAVISAPSGESVTIECNVTNKSSAIFVTWSLGCGDRTPLPKSDRVLYRSSNQQITILNLTKDDSGTYYCHMETAEMGLVSGNGTRLKVTRKPCPTGHSTDHSCNMERLNLIMEAIRIICLIILIILLAATIKMSC